MKSHNDEVVRIHGLHHEVVINLLEDLLDKLGYEVRFNKDEGEFYLCEKFGMTGAQGTYDRDQ